MKSTNLLTVALMTLLPWTCVFAQPGTCGVKLTQDPLVMRIGKDEFRIAFGLDAATCKEAGCSGQIKYKATWQAEDGTRNSEQKSVGFSIPSGAERSLTVDRSYFDNGEAQHTTEVVGVDNDVVAAPWPINDTAASLWASTFYKQLSPHPTTEEIGDALRASMLRLRDARAFRHPRYWASLVHLARIDLPAMTNAAPHAAAR